MNAQPMASEPALTAETTLSEVLNVLTETIPIEMKGDFQPNSLFEVLLHAACNECSVQQSSRELENVPTGNAMRHHINKLDDVDELEDYVGYDVTKNARTELSTRRADREQFAQWVAQFIEHGASKRPS